MRRFKILTAALLVLTLLFVHYVIVDSARAESLQSKPTASESTELDALLAQLESTGQSVQDLTSDYVEEKHTALLKEPLVSRGTVYVKGGRTRWVTTVPYESTLYTDESRVAIYFPDRKTMEVYPLDRRLRSLVVSPVPRVDALRRNFRLELMESDEIRDTAHVANDQVGVRLTPVDESLAQLISEVRVTIRRDTGLARRVEILDPDDELTVLTFSNTKTNTGLSDTDVQWNVPSDTHIVEPLGQGAGKSLQPESGGS